MKEMFNRDNYTLSTFNKEQRKQSLFIAIMIFVLFIASSFTFFNFLYGFADAVGSIVSGSADVAIKDLLYSLPLFFTFLMSIFALVIFQINFRSFNNEKRSKSTHAKAVTITAIAVVNVFYVIIMVALGKYTSFIEGSPSPLYPLNTILYSLVFIAFGVFGVLYNRKFEAKFPYLLEARTQKVNRARGAYYTFLVFWTLIALFGFADFCFGLFIIDFAHGYLLYSIAFLLAMLLPAVYMLVWNFFYHQMTEEKKKVYGLPLAIVALVVAAAVIAFYLVALSLNLDGPSNVGFGVLPVAFAASVNIATLLVVFTPLIVSITFLVKALIARKRKE